MQIFNMCFGFEQNTYVTYVLLVLISSDCDVRAHLRAESIDKERFDDFVRAVVLLLWNNHNGRRDDGQFCVNADDMHLDSVSKIVDRARCIWNDSRRHPPNAVGEQST